MTSRGPRPGDVYLAAFPEHDPRGHEQEGIRPTLILAVPRRPRFPVLLAAPMTTDHGQSWARAAPETYVRLAKGTGGLPADSILLLDQTRSLDAARVRRFLGSLDKKALDAVLATWIGMFRR
jgi:mRNA interferase MazF